MIVGNRKRTVVSYGNVSVWTQTTGQHPAARVLSVVDPDPHSFWSSGGSGRAKMTH